MLLLLLAALPTLTREDFSAQEVEDYFNYMGMLAAEVRVISSYLGPGSVPV